MEYRCPITKDYNVLHPYLGWNTKKNFKWTVDSTYRSVWINTDITLCTWKPRKGSKSETITIPQKHIDFAKNNVVRIVDVENDVKNGYEVKNGDGKT